MVDLMYCLKKLLFFDIPSLYYYISLRSLIFCYLFSGHLFGISLLNFVFSVCFSTVFELTFGELFDTFVTLSAILLQIKSPVGSAVF